MRRRLELRSLPENYGGAVLDKSDEISKLLQ